MTLAYLTAALPYGASETFAIAEIEALRALGHTVHVVPLRRPSGIVHADALGYASPPLAPTAVDRARSLADALRLARHARTVRIAAKNAAALWFGAGIASRLRVLGVEHVHAFWASTPATVAMAAAARAGLSWSLTAHRWDVYEDNLLARKLASASFARAVSSAGEAVLRGADALATVVRIPVGVAMPPHPAPLGDADGSAARPLRVLVAASLLPVKGHAVLVEAAGRAQAAGVHLAVTCVGDGPLMDVLRADAARRNAPVVFAGRRSHADVLTDLRTGAYDLAALPSIVVPPSRRFPGGAFEGVPVFLMEAMAAGVPVVSTASGSIADLVAPDSGQEAVGVLVPPGDAATLTDALIALARDPTRRAALAAAGRARVAAAFRADTTAAALADRFADAITAHRA